jgi:hypothetical protein
MKDYDYVTDYYDGVAVVKLNRKYGFIDKNGDELCECKYDYIFNTHREYSEVGIGHKHGFINKQGVEIVSCIFNRIDANIMLEKYKLNLRRIQKLKIII